MKRKSPTASSLPHHEEDYKPQLKKNKPFNLKGTPHSIESSNSKEKLSLTNNSKDNDTSVDRYLDSLVLSEKTTYTLAKENLMNIEENKVCKNLNETYKERDNSLTGPGEATVKINLHGLNNFKDARKLAKLNKLDENHTDTFQKKITKKLGMQLQPAKASYAQRRDIEKRALREKNQSNSQPKKASSSKLNSNNDSGFGENCVKDEGSTMITETSTGQSDPLSGVKIEFPEAKLEVIDQTVVIPEKPSVRRNPAENKWTDPNRNIQAKNSKDSRDSSKSFGSGRVGTPGVRQKESSIAVNTPFKKPESKTPKPVRSGTYSGSTKTRTSSASSADLSVKGRSASGASCKSDTIKRVVAKVNPAGMKSAGRVDRKEVGSVKSGGAVEKKSVVSKVVKGTDSAVKAKEENVILKRELDQQRFEIDEMSKENGQLVRQLEAMECEKTELVKAVEEKQQCIAEKEMEIEGIRKQLILSEFYRTNLHNYIQDLRGNLRIFCRVKPIKSPRKSMVCYPQKNTNIEDISTIPLKSLEIGNPQSKSIFYFDRVFDESLSQETIFEEILPFIQSAVDGEKVCILAYGQTGSGKTHTMEGPNLDQAKAITSESGILPRAVDFIFREIKRLEIQNNHIDLQMACMEIYNENLTDLLGVPETGSTVVTAPVQGNSTQVNGKDKAKDKEKEKDKDKDAEKDSKLLISFTGNKVIVSGLTWVPIKDNQQLFALVSRASKTRVTDKTSWNEKSSRSHCIYRLKLIRSDGKEGLLNIVDLAGSERADSKSFEDKSAMEISRMKKIQAEANYINKSLTTLGRILRLISEKKSENVIPYRESKLTRILQDSLGGNGKTLMFINICPSEENLFQSKESLKFSVKACL